MITLVYINLNKIQEYIYDSIYQSILTNQCKIIVVLEKCYITEFYTNLDKWNIQTNNVFCVPTKVLENINTKQTQELLDKFNLKEFRNCFWESTIKRLVYLDSLINTFNLINVYHIENDVMLYYPLKIFKANKIILLKDSPKRVIGSIMYINKKGIMDDLIEYLINSLIYNFANDMDILGNYQNAEYFNTEPNGNDYVYDGACLGQYIGGIDYRNISDFNPQDKKIIFNNELSGFVNETAELKPDKHDIVLHNGKYFIDDCKIMNLHIHSKQLFNFSSFKINFNQIITGDRVLSLCDFVFVTNQIYRFHKGIDTFSNHIFIIESFQQINMNIVNEKILENKNKIVNLFVYTHILNEFIYYIIPKLTCKKMYNIYLHNSDHSFDVEHIKLIDNDNIKNVYAQNVNIIHKKVKLLPIGIANSMWKHGDLISVYQCIIDNYKLKKTKNVYININGDTFPYRKELLLEINKQGSKCSINKNYNEYLQELSQHFFCLCPRGNGLESHRFWESIYLGVVPIIINNSKTNCDTFVQNLHILNVPFYEITSENTSHIIKEILNLTEINYSSFSNKNWLITLEMFKS